MHLTLRLHVILCGFFKRSFSSFCGGCESYSHIKNLIFLVDKKDSLKTYLIAVSFVLLTDSHLDDVNLFKPIPLSFSLNCIIQTICIE